MSSSASDLETPVLLLAMPQVLDPFFHKSVVLLVHHNEEGSFGFIVNRPTEIELEEILEGMKIAWRGVEGALAYFGGPVQSQMGTVMFSAADSKLPDQRLEEATREVYPGIRISQQLEDLGHLAGNPPQRFRLFLGYAGWGVGQLVEEIMRNDWLTAPVREDLLFSTEPESVWETALHSVGVDPSALPSWTQQEAGEKAN
jgi:putative transcriptional regulator